MHRPVIKVRLWLRDSDVWAQSSQNDQTLSQSINLPIWFCVQLPVTPNVCLRWRWARQRLPSLNLELEGGCCVCMCMCVCVCVLPVHVFQLISASQRNPFSMLLECIYPFFLSSPSKINDNAVQKVHVRRVPSVFKGCFLPEPPRGSTLWGCSPACDPGCLGEEDSATHFSSVEPHSVHRAVPEPRHTPPSYRQLSHSCI